LERFNQERGLSLEAYSLATYGNMLWLGMQNPQTVITIICDRVEQLPSKLEKAKIYAKSDTYYPGVTDLIQLSCLNNGLSAKNFGPVQAADFAAWEIRKHHENQNEFWERGDRPTDPAEAQIHLTKWHEEKVGSQLAPRKSLDALLGEAAFDGIVWDYKVLCEAHEARGGVWV
jgi:hypothetical protein